MTRRNCPGFGLCLVVSMIAIAPVAAGTPPDRNQPTTAPERSGPLAGLPSKEGPHIARVRALGADGWLDLGRPAPDPKWGPGRGRAWCAHMNYAADLRGAFHTGEGVHAYVKPDGYYMDDLFFYDLNAHAWICLYPGTQAGDDQGLRLNDDGFFVNQAGDLVAVAQLAHNYGGTTYDGDRGRFVIMPNQFVRNWWAPAKLRQIEKLVPEAREKLKGKTFSPWYWNAANGKFQRDAATGPWPGDSVGHGAVTLYLPSIKKLFFRDMNQRNWLYDPDKKAWAKAAAGPKADTGNDMVACHDSKRDRIYLPANKATDGAYGWYAYDVQADKWIDLKPKGGGRPADENWACVTYDTANDVVVVAYRADSKDGAFKRGLFIYDPKTNAWLNDQPKAPPTGWGRGCVSGFYDSANNAHYYFQAYDSNTNGQVWVYRYGRGAGVPSR